LLFCPNAFEAYRAVDLSLILKSNIWSFSWGIANVLCGLCFVRVGISLTGGLLTGLGVSLGISIPMVFKGSGLFEKSPDIFSPAGQVILVGVVIMIVGAIFISLAGFGRDKVLNKVQSTSGSFVVGFIMAVVAGFLSCGLSFAFVYSQGPIVEAMKMQGASETAANFAVWAVGLLGGAATTVFYPAYLMTKKKSWSILLEGWKEIPLAMCLAFSALIAVLLMGRGMVLMGVLGASVGFGVYQALQLIGNQGVGFVSGEWKGVYGKPRWQVYVSIALLILASIIMAYGNAKAPV
jgi:hypothetical protein